MKVDLKRELKHLYSASGEPTMVDVPRMQFLMIDGHGDPNTAPAYAAAVEALYTVAYTAKFAVRKGPAAFDFGVMPMEGLWWVPDMAAFSVTKKEDWDWTMMIMQPEQVTEEVFRESAAGALKKKPYLPDVASVRLELFAEGRSAQLLHTGPYSAEGPAIERLHDFIAQQGCALSGKHHEIYLSDARRAAPDKLKTLLRQPVGPATPSASAGTPTA